MLCQWSSFNIDDVILMCGFFCFVNVKESCEDCVINVDFNDNS